MNNQESAEIVKEIIKANVSVVYEDAAKASVRVVGKSLAQCVSLFTTPLGRMAEIFEKNIHRYIDKLDGLSEEEIVAPSTRILVPILEKLRFTDEEKVADYYAEILATASQKDRASRVMVTFIEILNRLSSDEIKILEYISSPLNNVPIPKLTEDEVKKHNLDINIDYLNVTGSFPTIDINLYNDKQSGFKILHENFNCLHEYINLDTPENVDFYIINLISLGLFEKKFSNRFAVDKIYHHLENHEIVIALKTKLEKNAELKIKFDRGRVSITHLGKKLLKLCSRKD